jgi:hypothetical protein
MKKFLIVMIIVFISASPVIGQESKKAAKERHKNYWKKVGTDTRDFWKGEHEKKMKKKEEREDKQGNAKVKEERKGPPKPPNPFKKKARKEPADKEE